ncbi:Splicing factor-like protein [Parasponia andersonii]|uniref:Splicing factor-like protein n=1 Tax=Parasponia andersonii TaxID=3476 RepID=A0A2P5BMD9_PARAD|nr:Splicing factor-like protein [Parasponia andersonii]
MRFLILCRRTRLAKGTHNLLPLHRGELSPGLDPGLGLGRDLFLGQDLDPGQGLGIGPDPEAMAGQGPEVMAVIYVFLCLSLPTRSESLNPGNTLYVTGLSTRVTERDLEEHFSKEGKVASCFLVVEPRSRISRGFAFVTMDSLEDADRCIKYLNQSVLEGRYITVERVFWLYSEHIASAMLAAIKDDEFIHVNFITKETSKDSDAWALSWVEKHQRPWQATVVNVIVVGIVEDQVVMTMDLVGLQDAHRIKGVVIILPGTLLHMAEDQGETAPGHLMVAQKGGMSVAEWLWPLGEAKFGSAKTSSWQPLLKDMLPSTPTLLSPQSSHLFRLLPISHLSLSTASCNYKLKLSLSPSPPTSVKFPRKFHVFSPSFQPSSFVQDDNEEEDLEVDDEYVIGDCVVFEEGVFEDPNLEEEAESYYNAAKEVAKPNKGVAEIVAENLVPDKWREVQAEINITKKERRKIAQELEFGTRVEKRTKGLAPLRNVNLEDYLAYREAKLAQLKPLVLDNPSHFPDRVEEEGGKGSTQSEANGSSSGRVTPKNPRWAVYGKGFDDVTEFFNSGHYDPAEKKSQGLRKLFSKEEKVLLNKRIPDLEAATSEKWLPLHTLAASGAFYLVDAVLKHNADINAVDKDDWTAIHKAIIGKKQAITNYLLRESANPFVSDKDGATLMHYAVRTASSQAIKILLLYNVDINLQDNDGWTPLHLSVQARRTDVVKLLLIKGADKTLKNKDGLTPLDICLYSGRDSHTYELIKLLKQFPKRR